MLLLKNGETLEGSISRSGDYYLVVTPTTELQVRARDAEAVCRDLEDVFVRKASLINVRNVEDHLALAQWAIDRGLYGHAARALTEAYRVDDTHPRCALLERRLKAAMAAPREVVPPPKAAAPSISDAELNESTRSISADSLHEFTVRVQPLLMNYCATAGCHGPRGNDKFQLQRAYLNERSDPRAVKMNLHEVLKLVDRKSPSASKLLTVPISPHGGAKRAVFHAHNAEHYRAIAAWVGRVSMNSRATTSTSRPASEPGTLSQRLPIAAPAAATVELPKSAGVPADPSLTVPSSAANAAPAAAAAQPSSSDPFDPAEFNRGRPAPSIVPLPPVTEPTPESTGAPQ
ncbi:MAG: hypothetical protein C0483_09435 [Pirellula sp.]|nr:hypothetical protein [Pirellula sp.]